MTTDNRSRQELLDELEEVRYRLEEAEETLQAIRTGGVDALVISRPGGEHIFTLESAEHPYRVLVESMNEGAVTLSPDGDILYCNRRLATMLQVPLEKLIGTSLASYMAPEDQPRFAGRIAMGGAECEKEEVTLIPASGGHLPVLVSCCRIDVRGSDGMSVVLTDMSYQKQAEARVREAEIQARVAEERERAADALRESEHKFRLLFESSPDAVFLTSPDGTVLSANPAATAMFGMSESEICNAGREALADPDDPRHAAVVEKRGYSRQILKAELDYVRKNGERFTAEVDSVILSQDPPRSFVILRDITERKRADDELRSAHDRIKAILEQMSDGFASFDKEWRYTYVNSAASRAFITDPEELLGKSIWEMWPQAYDLPVGINFRRSVAEGIQINFETYYPAPLDRWFECRCHPTTEGLATFFTDITERKRVEEALKESEERFRVAQELSPDGFTILRPVRDDRGRVVDFTWLFQNPAIAQMNGTTSKEVIGRRLLELMPGHRGSPFFEAYRHVAETGEAQVFEAPYRGDTIVAETWFRLAIVRMSRDIAILAQDITERKRAEEELRRAHGRLELRVQERTAELREKDQMLLVQGRQAAMGEMIGNIAHQWRQPLNALGLTIQQLLLLQELGELDADSLKKNVEKGMELINHMSETIDDFRSYFKPDKQKANFRLSEAVTKTLALIQDSFKNYGIAIEVITDDDPVVFGYRNEFAQALLNILNNARDVLSERKVTNPEVTITVASEDGKAILTIADNAGGIPEEIVEKIFDPYFTTKGPQSGTGVGLYMSKTIIEKNMGGTLSARNTSKGAEFTIEV